MLEIAQELLNAITEKGFEAYIVGGYVRDLYIDKKSDDVDICTSATPKDLKNIFSTAILPKEIYGSVTLVYKNIRFEITTFRAEMKYINNRIPSKVEYINDLLTDLKRRDFTINTICMDPNGNYIDLLEGRKDIDNKIIKTVTDASESMQIDALRILRAIRFATVLDFELDEELKEAIRKNRELLLNLSFYRKKSELDKIFNSQNVKKGIALIEELGLSKYLNLTNLAKVNPKVLGIAIWAQLDGIDKYPFNKVEKEQIKNIRSLIHESVLDNYNLYRYGLYISQIVGELKGLDKTKVTKAYNSLQIKRIEDIDITIYEICQILNRKPDAFLKEILFDLERKILYNKLNNKKKNLKSYIKRQYM